MQKIGTDWKVYTPAGEYTAATKYPAEAAMLVAVLGEGSKIKYQHHTLVWSEGEETQSASDSYDFVTDTCIERVNESRRLALAVNDLRTCVATWPIEALEGDSIAAAATRIAVTRNVDLGKLINAYTDEKKRRARA